MEDEVGGLTFGVPEEPDVLAETPGALEAEGDEEDDIEPIEAEGDDEAGSGDAEAEDEMEPEE